MAVDVQTLRHPGRRATSVSLSPALRWLRADARDVVTLAPGPGRQSVDHQLDDRSADVLLDRELDSWGVRIQRARLPAVAQRALLAALLLALLLEGAVALGLPSIFVMVGPTLALIACTVLSLGRRPSRLRIARLLDDAFRLSDRLASAVELQSLVGAAGSELQRRLLNDALLSLQERAAGGRVRPRTGAREWLALAVAAAALAVILVVPAPGAAAHQDLVAGARTGSSANGGAGAPASGRTTAPSHPAAVASTPRSTSPAATERAASVPYGYHAPHSGSLTAADSKSTSAAAALAQAKQPQGKATAKGLASYTRPGQHSAGGSQAARSGAEASSKAGAVVPVKAQRPPAASAQLQSMNAAGHHGASPSSPSRSAAATPRTGSGARTPGGGAGHERGAEHSTAPHSIAGKATGALPVRAGYAPLRSGSAPANRSGNPQQGQGGKGGTANVTGVAGGTAEGFGLVPAEGGSLAGGAQQLLREYLKTLKWVKELSSW